MLFYNQDRRHRYSNEVVFSFCILLWVDTYPDTIDESHTCVRPNKKIPLIIIYLLLFQGDFKVKTIPPTYIFIWLLFYM